jgi:biotin carboxylase
MADSTSRAGGERGILFVSGGREAVPAILEARRMGLRVLVSDGAAGAPGLRLADVALIASTYDAGATVEAARALATRHRIDGVLAVGADVPVTVAAVADALGLPGLSLESAHLAADKLAMKDALLATGVPVPWYAAVESVEELEDVLGQVREPLILKPVDSRGARGVIRLLPGVDPAWAYEVAAGESPTGRVMVETFIVGPQVSTESVVIQGRTHTLGFSDRNYELLDRFAPYVIENGGELPSCLPAAARVAIEDVVAQAVAALGIRHGTVKGDIVVGHEGPMVIELAARLSGGYFCTHEIPLATGVNFVQVAIRLALGDEPDPADLAPRWSRGVAQRYLFPAPGVVLSVRGAAEAAAGEGVELCEVRVAPGDRLEPITSHVRRAGVVIAVGDTREEAVRRAITAAARVRVVTTPVSPVVSEALH